MKEGITKYGIVELIGKGKKVHGMANHIIEYQGELWRILICTKEPIQLFSIIGSRKKGWSILEYDETDTSEGKYVEIQRLLGLLEFDGEIFREQAVQEAKSLLKAVGIINAMTLFVDESGNRRNKAKLTRLLGRSLVRKLIGHPPKDNHMSYEETKKLCDILGWDIKKDLLQFFKTKGVTNSVELFGYRNKFKNGEFINQSYINVLNNDKSRGHMNIRRTLELAQGLGRNIYDDIMDVSNKKGLSVTNILLSSFKGNISPLSHIQPFISYEEYSKLHDIVLQELIDDIERIGIPRGLFKIMGLGRLQNELVGIHLHKRVSMVLGQPVSHISSDIRSAFLKYRNIL